MATYFVCSAAVKTMENCLKHVDFFIVLKMTHLIQAWVIFIFTMNKLTYRIFGCH